MRVMSFFLFEFVIDVFAQGVAEATLEQVWRQFFSRRNALKKTPVALRAL